MNDVEKEILVQVIDSKFTLKEVRKETEQRGLKYQSPPAEFTGQDVSTPSEAHACAVPPGPGRTGWGGRFGVADVRVQSCLKRCWESD